MLSVHGFQWCSSRGYHVQGLWRLIILILWKAVLSLKCEVSLDIHLFFTSVSVNYEYDTDWSSYFCRKQTRWLWNLEVSIILGFWEFGMEFLCLCPGSLHASMISISQIKTNRYDPRAETSLGKLSFLKMLDSRNVKRKVSNEKDLPVCLLKFDFKILMSPINYHRVVVHCMLKRYYFPVRALFEWAWELWKFYHWNQV